MPGFDMCFVKPVSKHKLSSGDHTVATESYDGLKSILCHELTYLLKISMMSTKEGLYRCMLKGLYRYMLKIPDANKSRLYRYH